MDYRGPIKFRYKLFGNGEKMYDIGDRVGQLVIIKLAEFSLLETDKLEDSSRGIGGFGSTGK